MPSKAVTEIQGKLYKSLGIGHDAAGQAAHRGGRSTGGRPATRKDQRKAQRVQKKSHRYSRNGGTSLSDGNGRPFPPIKPSKPSGPPHSGPKSVLKKPTPSKGPSHKEDDEDLNFDQSYDDSESDLMGDMDSGDSEEEQDDGIDGITDTSRLEGSTAGNPKISRSMQEKLDQDDAEIEDFERKLGIKKGRKSLPQSFKDDGLSLLLDGLDDPMGASAEEDGSGEETTKRKRDYDEWLSSKRRKAEPQQLQRKKPDNEESDSEMEFDDDDDDISMDDLDGDVGAEEEEDYDDGDSFGGFDDDEEQPGEQSRLQQTRQRENPYVAPTTGPVVAKYVPPSLRKSTGSAGEAMDRLRKQGQGLINRLTDANILSIVHAAEEIYQKNARGDVTEMFTDIILAQVCKPEALPDQFFVLMGGFSAAIYKIIGSSFGSHLIRRVVKDFGEEYDRARAIVTDESAIPKEPSNLLTFLSQLYVFEVVRCKIMFDYMERLLSDLTEINVELLLRICRNGGRLLRRDDPQALKNVSVSLHRAVSKKGLDNVSARTKFMVETIDDLKNKKAKGKGMDSAMVSEHVVRMKKRLGELKSQSRRLDGLTPMGVDLEDVVEADTRGKWWLVGASVPVKKDQANESKSKSEAGSDQKAADEEENSDFAFESESEDMDFVLPDYPKKARAQGLGSSSQIAIFTALMTASDAQTGYRQFLNLKLRKDDQLEIARVLVQCAGSEAEYNPYYAAVAERACTSNRIRFALQARLWQIFRAMGESLFGDDVEDTDTADGVRFQDKERVRKVAQFYASLVAQGTLRMTVLKPLGLPEMEPQTRVFLESFLVSLLQECKSKHLEKEDARVEKAFGPARDISKLAAGLDWFMREKLRKTKLMSPTKLKKLDRVKDKAQAALQGGVPADE